MRNYLNKVLALLLVVVVGLTLVACNDKNDNPYNENVPYGDLTDTVYASYENLKITEKELYDEMRSSGYDYLLKMLEIEVLKAAGFNLTVAGNEEKLKSFINSACFGTDDAEEIEKIDARTKKQNVEKYVDSMYVLGVNDIAFNGENFDAVYSPKALEFYLPELIKENYAKSLINDENSKYYYKNEFQKENGEDILDEDGNQIENICYISDEDIEDRYIYNKNKENYYTVVIVSFSTLANAQKALEGFDANSTTKTVAEQFKEMYAATYTYRDADYTFTDAELSKFDSTLVSVVKKMEAGDFLLNQEFGNKIYHVFLEATKPEAKFEDATQDEKDAIVEELKDEAATSTFISNVVKDKVVATDITIFDPVYDALYSIEKEGHVRLEKSKWTDSNKNLIAKFGDNEITVRELFTKLETELGVSTAADYFTNTTLLNKYSDKVTAEQSKEIDESIKSTIDKFNNGEYESYGYPASLGEEIFKFMYYGNSNDDVIKGYYKTQKIWEYLAKDKNDQYFNILEKVSKQYYEKYFSLSVKHILIGADFDGDGTLDNPDEFLKQINPNKVDQFKQDVVALMNAVLAETHYLIDEGYEDLLDALTYVLKQYYANGVIHYEAAQGNEVRWSKYNTFNFTLTIEDLMEINPSSVSKYVPEFGEGVKALYKVLLEKDMDPNNDEFSLGDDYLVDSITDINDSNLIKTSYGYHVLGVYDSAELVSAKYTSTDDYANQYKTIKVEINGEKIELNAYNSELYASINQIKIYDAQVDTTNGVKNLPSDVRLYIANFYEEVVKRYEDAQFQTILFMLKDLSTISFADNSNKVYYDEFVKIQQRSFDKYTDYSKTSDSHLAGWWESFLEPAPTPEEGQ